MWCEGELILCGAGGSSNCLTKDCVYSATCKICEGDKPDKYGGETANLRTRTNTHNSDFKGFHLLKKEDQEKSAVAKHFRDQHPDHNLYNNVVWKVEYKTHGWKDRKYTEACMCKYRRDEFSINRRLEGSGCIDGHFRN